jgi:hypothetical protein
MQSCKWNNTKFKMKINMLVLCNTDCVIFSMRKGRKVIHYFILTVKQRKAFGTRKINFQSSLRSITKEVCTVVFS